MSYNEEVEVIDDALEVSDPYYILVEDFHPWYNDLYSEAFRFIENSPQPYIPIVVDSPGGYVWCLNVLLDMIQDTKKPVITIASGITMSCGAVLSAMGTKGLRIIGANTQYMIHEAAGGTCGKSSDMLNDAKASQTVTDRIFKKLDSKTGKDEGYTEQLTKEIRNADLFLSAEDVVKYGYADIVMGRVKALNNLDAIYNRYLISKGEIDGSI